MPVGRAIDEVVKGRLKDDQGLPGLHGLHGLQEQGKIKENEAGPCQEDGGLQPMTERESSRQTVPLSQKQKHSWKRDEASSTISQAHHTRSVTFYPLVQWLGNPVLEMEDSRSAAPATEEAVQHSNPGRQLGGA